MKTHFFFLKDKNHLGKIYGDWVLYILHFVPARKIIHTKRIRERKRKIYKVHDEIRMNKNAHCDWCSKVFDIVCLLPHIALARDV